MSEYWKDIRKQAMQIITESTFHAEGVAGAKTDVGGCMAFLRNSKETSMPESE